MSHRKSSKRRRDADGDDDFSPSLLPHKKRSKSQEEIIERNESPQHALYDADTGVRRSSRTPKPKVFDDEETAVIGRTAEASLSSKPGDSGVIQPVDQPPANSKPITPKNEAAISRKQRKSNPTLAYDEGHKRETRRSYQNYLEELKTEPDVWKQGRDELESARVPTNRKEQSSHDKKVTQSNSVKRKSDVSGQPCVDTTPRSTGVTQKSSKEKGTSNIRSKRETPDEYSPKVRTSSRTPVPKRIFSLLEQEENEEQKSDVLGSPGAENESLDLSLANVRSSSRAHVPKKSFPLLEKEEAKEELTSFKTRTPKLQGTKRRLSAAAEGSEQSSSKNTPETCDEPSAKVRVSSRGHKPKRTFSLLEGEEGSEKMEEGSNPSEMTYEEEKFVLKNLIEQQMSTVTKEPKRRKSNSGQQSEGKKKELIRPSNHGSERSGGAVIKVEASQLSGDTRAAATSDNTAVVITPGLSKSTAGKTQPEGSKGDQNKGRSSKRKGKPVKKKVVTSEEIQISRVNVTDVKVKVEPGYETIVTPKATKPKGSSKKKQANESSKKQGQSLGKSVVKKECTENTKGFSLSDIAMGVIDSSAASSDINTSVSKGKKKAKQSKNTLQKVNKDKRKVVDKPKKISSNSESKTEEHEHIILKLQLPHAEDSTKHKKHHHHHHHHHHHKHRHSSGSHQDGSPKKSHHKKSATILPDDRNKKAVTKKKKISIKFKGLSDTDLEKATSNPEQNTSVELESSETHPKESGKKKKKPKKAISRNGEQLLPSSQSESEHVKLVIKKDKIPTGNKSEDAKKKKITKPTASTSDEQKKNATPATESKKAKGSSTPAKNSKKSPQVCNISNTGDSVSSGYPNPEKRVENTVRSGVFLTKFEVFG